ncbi:MAG TPA: hypothetical protein VJN67_05825 [Stellaceae bacterium]|nr:hypothetical protein [Stellaceae bacterium]
MRPLCLALLVIMEAASPVLAETNYAAPLSPSAAAFKGKFAGRRITCQSEAAMRLGISSGAALKFCDCQIDVFARGLTLDEMRAVELATFGSDDEADANASAAIAATNRLIPERQRVCGH